MEEKVNLHKELINYEKAFGRFFKELDMKPNHCQLIRAFVLVSEGKTVFEASFADLASVFHKKELRNPRPDTNARNAFRTLLEWQEKHEIELIRVLKRGQRVEKAGKYEYTKTQYEFVALEELVKVLYSDSESLESVVEEALIKIKAQYVPVKKARAYTPRHLLQKAKKTIYTKLERIFELAIRAGMHPTEECELMLRDSFKRLNELDDEYKEKQNRKEFINEFESKLDLEKRNLEVVNQ
jgi:hypothetical protein